MFARRAVVLLAVLALACDRDLGGARGAGSAAGGAVVLHGAGASFPYPLYSKWVAEYGRIQPGVRINYQSIGSGGGIRQMAAKTVDFAATDTPMRPDEVSRAGGRVLHVPAAVGSVVVSYNLAGLTRPLRLTPELLSGIFLGRVRRWNHPELVAVNPGLALPASEITVVFRSDGSGTTAIFSEFLAQADARFREVVGAGKSVRWPIGLGAKGNEGVTGQLKSVPGALGYTELAYATQSGLASAEIRNQAGYYVRPTPEAAAAAAASVGMPDDLQVSLARAQGPGAYPLASYTYLLVYEQPDEPEKGRALAHFLWWAIHDGQRYAAALDYAPLPAHVVEKLETRLLELRSGGTKLLDGV